MALLGGERVQVYLDLVVLLNGLVDGLLLLGVNRMAGLPSVGRRILLAAGLGGLYGGACLLPGFGFLGNPLWRLIFLGLISGIAFGLCGSALLRGCLFAVLSMALGGIALGLEHPGFVTLVTAAACLLLLCALGFSGKRKGKLLPVEVSCRGRILQLTALQDTGNTLCDPLTGSPVLIMGAQQARQLLGFTPAELADPLETMLHRQVPGLRLIPFRTVDQPAGMLLGIRCDRVKIGREAGGRIVAFSPQDFPAGGGYQALTGGSYGTLDSVTGWAAGAADRLLHRRQRYSAAAPEGGGGAACAGGLGAGG